MRIHHRFRYGSGKERGDQENREQVFRFVSTVREAEEGGPVHLDVRCESVALRRDGAGGVEAFDSARGRGSPPGAHPGLARLAGRTFGAVVGPRGAVREITGVESLVESATAQARRQGKKGEPDVTGRIREELTAEALAELFGRALLVYPEEALQYHARWKTETRDCVGPCPMSVKHEYVFFYRKGRDLTFKDEATASSVQGEASAGYELTGTRTATYNVNERFGWPRNVEVEQKLSGTVTTRGPDGKTSSRPLRVHTSLQVENRVSKPR